VCCIEWPLEHELCEGGPSEPLSDEDIVVAMKSIGMLQCLTEHERHACMFVGTFVWHVPRCLSPSDNREREGREMRDR
jgi:hypothetical protein